MGDAAFFFQKHQAIMSHPNTHIHNHTYVTRDCVKLVTLRSHVKRLERNGTARKEKIALYCIVANEISAIVTPSGKEYAGTYVHMNE